MTRDNFRIKERARDIVDAFLPRHAAETDGDDLLPYIAWALGVRQMEGEKIVRQSGPGYVLGAIERRMIDDGIVITVDNGRDIAFALREPYDETLIYMIDCVDRVITIDAS